jgi:hypothetical protein
VVVDEFDRDRRGSARLVRGRHRFAGLPRAIQIDLGDDVYGPAVVAADSGDGGGFRPTVLMERLSVAIEGQPGIAARDLREAVKGKTSAKGKALALLIAEGFVRAETSGQTIRHHSVSPFRKTDEEAGE